MKKLITIFMMACYVLILANCGKAEFSGGAVQNTSSASLAPVRPAESVVSGPKKWGPAVVIGEIGIYNGSAQKYGQASAPVVGAVCSAPYGMVYDLSTCQPNGQVCTSAERRPSSICVARI